MLKNSARSTLMKRLIQSGDSGDALTKSGGIATEYATEYAIENVRYSIYRKNHTICPDNTSYTPKINDKGTRNMGIK